MIADSGIELGEPLTTKLIISTVADKISSDEFGSKVTFAGKTSASQTSDKPLLITCSRGIV